MKIYGPLTTVESGDRRISFILDPVSGVVSCVREVGDKPTLLTIKQRRSDSFRIISAEYVPSIGFTFKLVLQGAEGYWKVSVGSGGQDETVVDVGGMFGFLADCLLFGDK